LKQINSSLVTNTLGTFEVVMQRRTTQISLYLLTATNSQNTRQKPTQSVYLKYRLDKNVAT